MALVTDPDEMQTAVAELSSQPQPTDYVILRVAEHERGGNANRAHDLRNRIQRDGHISREPTKSEREALEAGRRMLAQELDSTDDA